MRALLLLLPVAVHAGQPVDSRLTEKLKSEYEQLKLPSQRLERGRAIRKGRDLPPVGSSCLHRLGGLPAATGKPGSGCGSVQASGAILEESGQPVVAEQPGIPFFSHAARQGGTRGCRARLRRLGRRDRLGCPRVPARFGPNPSAQYLNGRRRVQRHREGAFDLLGPETRNPRETGFSAHLCAVCTVQRGTYCLRTCLPCEGIGGRSFAPGRLFPAPSEF